MQKIFYSETNIHFSAKYFLTEIKYAIYFSAKLINIEIKHFFRDNYLFTHKLAMDISTFKERP